MTRAELARALELEGFPRLEVAEAVDAYAAQAVDAWRYAGIVGDLDDLGPDDLERVRSGLVNE